LITMHAIEFEKSRDSAPHQIVAITSKDATVLAEKHPGFQIEAKVGAVTRIPGANGVDILIGVGEGLQTSHDYRELGASIGRLKLPGLRVALALALDDSKLAAVIAGIRLGGYQFNRYRSETVEFGTIVVEMPAVGAHAAELIASRVNQVRDLVNTPANDLWPERFVELAAELAGDGLEVEIWDEDRLAAERCGGLLAVGRGSTRPPRLMRISWHGTGKRFALVGKGITFDTGGLSLKPAEGMVGMKYDMAGAATVLGAVLAVADLRAEAHVDAYLCLAENMPSGSATRPGDVIRARNGKTIEVLNTDAEGRLVLADGLSLASETNPDHIVDVATLTGAATVALGNRYAGLMGRGEAISMLEEASERAGEQLWHMPMPAELRKLLDSDIADIANVKIGNRAGGMLIAGQFLNEFVSHESGSWGHLDIAGPANNAGSPYSVNPAGATGVMLRTLVTAITPFAS
jgi:leucyl aminopeptidase